jgi:hypothetical protein
MITVLRRLHPVHHNVPAVWNHFEGEFKAKFMDSTRELQARTQLDRLSFKYPNIDGYIAEFEDLITQANYNLASQEAINLFLKGFSKNRSLLDKVFTPPVPVTYDAMKRRLIAIVKSMQLVNSIAQNAPDFRTFRSNPQRPPPQGNQPTRGFAPRQVNSSNAPPWMSNMPVPMDTSNRARAPNWRNRQTYGNMAQTDPTYGNAAQTDQPPQRQWLPRKCFNCDKIGHLARQCRAPRKTQINSVIDEPEDMAHVQPAITPDGILENALAMFDRLPEQLKDDFVQQYEGKSPNFQDV